MKFNDAVWSLVPPRAWQADAFRKIESHFIDATPTPAIIQAVMGSGKSVLIAEVAASLQTEEYRPVVVTTSSQLLVRQIHQTITDRLKGMKSVGMYYADRKDSNTDIIVCCTPSAATLAAELAARNRQCSLWVADEAHKTQAETIIAAAGALKPEASLGFTATPFRSNHDERLTLFTDLIYTYTAADALRDGVVVPWKIESWQGGEVEIDEACIEMIAISSGPGIVNACSIEDADEFAKKLNDRGIRAAALHSRTKKDNLKFLIQSLKDNALRCIVHVAMLVEGADYPWLRWMCLRRNVDSRVRFLQEIGRALRASPGKKVATFYDPNDLFGLHRITYEAALGAEPSEEDIIEEVLSLPPQAMAEEIERMEEATALKTYEMEIRRLIVACDAAGMCPDRVIIKKVDRQKIPTGLQKAGIKYCTSIADPVIPMNWKRFFNLVSKYIDSLTYGAASDLCCILASIANTKKFPPLDSDGKISATSHTPPDIVPIAEVRAAPSDRLSQMEFELK